MKKIILIDHEPYTIHRGNIFYIDHLISCGFEVEVWDISAYLYYFNGYFVIDVIAFTKKVNDFEKLVLSSIKNRDSSERKVFELVKKDAITRISVR